MVRRLPLAVFAVEDAKPLAIVRQVGIGHAGGVRLGVPVLEGTGEREVGGVGAGVVVGAHWMTIDEFLNLSKFDYILSLRFVLSLWL
jgi:hypothetical protein